VYYTAKVKFSHDFPIEVGVCVLHKCAYNIRIFTLTTVLYVLLEFGKWQLLKYLLSYSQSTQVIKYLVSAALNFTNPSCISTPTSLMWEWADANNGWCLTTAHLTKIAVEHIKRTVIVIILHVLHKVFHLQLNRISSIIFPTFESLIPKPSWQLLLTQTTFTCWIHSHIQFLPTDYNDHTSVWF